MSHQGVKPFHQHCAVSLRLKAAPTAYQNFRDKTALPWVQNVVIKTQGFAGRNRLHTRERS